MQQDRFVKVMLVLIAALLGLNLAVALGVRLPQFASTAQAQVTKGVGENARTIDVRPVRGYQVSSLKEVTVLSDGKTFVVSNPNGFMVYQVDNFNQ